jgi:hypothetical protein
LTGLSRREIIDATTPLAWAAGESAVSATTVFEIRPGRTGFAVYSLTSWDTPSGPRQEGGLDSTRRFPSLETAMAWVREQFSVPGDAWQLRSDGVAFTGRHPHFDQFPVEPAASSRLPGASPAS